MSQKIQCINGQINWANGSQKKYKWLIIHEAVLNIRSHKGIQIKSHWDSISLQWMTVIRKTSWNQALVGHIFNPSYLGGWDQEDHSLRLAWANSSWYSISKMARAKWTRDVVQAVECLLASVKPWVQTSVPPPHQKGKKKTIAGEDVGEQRTLIHC
jgi:hypothetical protein